MPDYRIYVLGEDGHFFSSHPLVCADDSEAIKAAEQLIHKHGIELWQRDRKVAVFPSSDNAAEEPRP